MNGPNSPRRRIITLPQFSQYSSVSPASWASGVFRSGLPAMFSLVKVQLVGSFLLYAEQAKNVPNLPHFNTSGDPHSSHFSPVTCSIRLMVSDLKVQLVGSFLLYAEQAKNVPNLPHFNTSGDPHSSHFSPVTCSIRLMF